MTSSNFLDFLLAYEQFLVQRQEENQGMPNQEFMRLYAVLLQKRAAEDKFAMYLAKQPREQYVRLLPVLEDMRNKIGLLEAQWQVPLMKYNGSKI